MPEKLEEFDWSNIRPFGDLKLDEFLDGQIWKFTPKDLRNKAITGYRGTELKNLSILEILYRRRAKELGFELKIKRFGDESLVIQGIKSGTDS